MAEDHTLEHFKNFWFPTLADRTRLSTDQDSVSVKHAEDLLNEKTRMILETHQPKLLPEEVIAEIKRIEESWFKKSGLSYEYPKRQI
jgi:trimethylamine--corrinoid protein Co-methyltransferase